MDMLEDLVLYSMISSKFLFWLFFGGFNLNIGIFFEEVV